MRPSPQPAPDIDALIAWHESRWSGRGQRFVEEAPRYFDTPAYALAKARFATAMQKGVAHAE